jgi:ubiquinone/menaquinone biosynthesis C-methylase UbiE
MEGPIASWYAKNTARNLRRFREMARAIGERSAPDAHILEVAPGPGYLAIEIARSGRRVSAIDISHSFVALVRENARKAGVAVDVRQGNAAALPFSDRSFDFVVCSAAFKNFSDPVGALDEIFRVLKPGGQASIYDLRNEAPTAEIDAEVRRMDLSTWNTWLTRMIFKYGLLKRAYKQRDVERLAEASRFDQWEILPDGIGFELRLTRENAATFAPRSPSFSQQAPLLSQR